MPVKNITPVIILCGGRGARLNEQTALIPKPMVEVDGRPLFEYIVDIFDSQGFTNIQLAAGYKSWEIKRYLLERVHRDNDLVIGYKSFALDYQKQYSPRPINVIDTGLLDQTGSRVKKIVEHQINAGCERFIVTYGDGLANVDIDKLLNCHLASGKLATVTAVRPPTRFGKLKIEEDGTVTDFSEKPADTYINGGFMILERDFVLKYINDHFNCSLEDYPLKRAASNLDLNAYIHDGYWQCMDTYKDLLLLEEDYKKGCPWLWRS